MQKLIGILVSLVGAVAVIVLPQAFRPQQTLPAAVQASAQSATEEVMTNPAPYPNLGTAPEILDDVWLNTKDNSALRLADLRGQVVLVEFWTFECINCIHVLPHVRAWYNTYHEQGLEVIGVHYPEFSQEADYNNLVEAIKRLDVPFPVAQDNDGATWDAWGQHYWPTVYLIDKRGNIRYTQIGEGGYDQTNTAIQKLLAENT